jgi:hypothetical protein
VVRLRSLVSGEARLGAGDEQIRKQARPLRVLAYADSSDVPFQSLTALVEFTKFVFTTLVKFGVGCSAGFLTRILCGLAAGGLRTIQSFLPSRQGSSQYVGFLWDLRVSMFA